MLSCSGVRSVSRSSMNSRHTFHVDGPAEELWLASRCGVPAELELLSTDRRCLGVCVERLVLRDKDLRIEVSHSHPSLCEGFHEAQEGAWRWTDGVGRVPERLLRPFIGGFTVEAHCLPPMPRYRVEPPAQPSATGSTRWRPSAAAWPNPNAAPVYLDVR